jgi:hypothetical protein
MTPTSSSQALRNGLRRGRADRVSRPRTWTHPCWPSPTGMAQGTVDVGRLAAPTRLRGVPYVTCPHCGLSSYVRLSYRQRGELCPACEEPLSEPATSGSGRVTGLTKRREPVSTPLVGSGRIAPTPTATRAAVGRRQTDGSVSEPAGTNAPECASSDGTCPADQDHLDQAARGSGATGRRRRSTSRARTRPSPISSSARPKSVGMIASRSGAGRITNSASSR